MYPLYPRDGKNVIRNIVPKEVWDWHRHRQILARRRWMNNFLVCIINSSKKKGVNTEYDRHFFTHELLTSCQRHINTFIWPCSFTPSTFSSLYKSNMLVCKSFVSGMRVIFWADRWDHKLLSREKFQMRYDVLAEPQILKGRFGTVDPLMICSLYLLSAFACHK